MNGEGCVRKDGLCYYRPQGGVWQTEESFIELVTRLREENATIEVSVYEGLMSEYFRFDTYQKPF